MESIEGGSVDKILGEKMWMPHRRMNFQVDL